MHQVVIVGGGAAGLNCARHLHAAKVDFLLLEASESLGGRMRTDFVDGFRLDRGFQVLQTAYPEARAELDFTALQLKELEPGALIRKGGRWIAMSDPLRRPAQAFSTLFGGPGNMGDRLKLFKLWRDCNRGSIADLLARPDDCTTRELLADRYRFSDDFVHTFMQPWLGGIFLEKQLNTSANFFRFVFRMLASDKICYPAMGISAIAEQLASCLPAGSTRFNASVQSIEENYVRLWTGETIDCQRVVLAADLKAASEISGRRISHRDHNSTRCIYFATERPLASVPQADKPVLMLNGDGQGCVNQAFVMSNASPEVAPVGQTLVSVSQIGEDARAGYDAGAVRHQLHDWFGDNVNDWRELRVYDIERALPQQLPGFAEQRSLVELPHQAIACGDFCETASFNGALQSGRLAAEHMLRTLQS